MTCPEGTVKDSAAAADGQSCLKCTENCHTCSPDPNVCTSCAPGSNFFFKSSKCVRYCDRTDQTDPGTVTDALYNDADSQTCRACDGNCVLCFGKTSGECTKCQTNFFLYQTSCLSLCPSGYYNNPTGLCTPCPLGCKECSYNSAVECQSCLAPFFLDVNRISCISAAASCSDSLYYKDNTTRACQRCDIACLTCFGPLITNCRSCDAPYFLIDQLNTCSENCPQGYYRDSTTANECKACDASVGCETCDQSDKTLCLNCLPDFYYQFNR